MTDQPYTPTTDRIRDLFTFAVAWDAEPTKPHIFAMQENARDEFDRWLAERDAAIEAAAEQRGAEEGWDLAIDYAWDDSSIYEADAKRAKAANPYRADQEGDDE